MFQDDLPKYNALYIINVSQTGLIWSLAWKMLQEKKKDSEVKCLIALLLGPNTHSKHQSPWWVLQFKRKNQTV